MRIIANFIMNLIQPNKSVVNYAVLYAYTNPHR